MPVFTAQITGQPTIVFAARDHVNALAFVHDDFIRSELCGLRAPDGAQLWDGDAAVSVRPASADERAAWEHNLVEDLAAGVHESREDAIESNGFVFLVEYREPGD